MEKLSSFFDNVRERLNSPLIFSFLIAWCFFNWPVVVALLWYDPAQLSNEGYSSIFKFISVKTDNYQSILYPALSALTYTLLNPVVKNLVRAFYTYNTNWGENWNISISKSSKVSMEKYLKLRSHYDKRTQILEDTISKESVTQEKVVQTETALLESRNQQNKLAQEASDLRSIVDNMTQLRNFDGSWILTYKGGESINLHVQRESVYRVNGVSNIHLYRIDQFFYNQRNSQMSFNFFHVNNDNPDQPKGLFQVFDLRYQHNSWVGYAFHDNIRTEVSFMRPRETAQEIDGGTL